MNNKKLLIMAGVSAAAAMIILIAAYLTGVRLASRASDNGTADQSGELSSVITDIQSNPIANMPDVNPTQANPYKSVKTNPFQ